MSAEDFKDKNIIFQIGVAPVRINIMMDVQGVSFEKAWGNRKKTKFGKSVVNVIGLEDLIAAKKKAKRVQDELDLEKLNKARRKR